jgi:putative resolvase
VKTLHRWHKAGKFVPTLITPNGHRRYSLGQIAPLLGQEPPREKARCVVYARVSSAKQESDGNLDRQKQRLTEAAHQRGYELVRVVTEQASGLNEKRRGLKTLMSMAEQRRIDVVLIEFQDRLARFGYAYLARYFNSHSVRVETVSSKPADDATTELVQDMLAIVTCFSARLYGQRSQAFRRKVQQTMTTFQACPEPYPEPSRREQT